MTEQWHRDGAFLFRKQFVFVKQFDVTAKRIVCKKESQALKDFLENYSQFYLIREAFNKKNGEFSDIVQKGGRGSDQKPNFMNTEKK